MTTRKRNVELAEALKAATPSWERREYGDYITVTSTRGTFRVVVAVSGPDCGTVRVTDDSGEDRNVTLTEDVQAHELTDLLAEAGCPNIAQPVEVSS